jgi:hypothetical protein
MRGRWPRVRKDRQTVLGFAVLPLAENLNQKLVSLRLARRVRQYLLASMGVTATSSVRCVWWRS